MMTRIRSLIAAMVTVYSGSIAMAQGAAPNDKDIIAIYMTGENLTTACRSYLTLVRAQMKGGSQLTFEAARCNGYVVGVLDTMAFEGTKSSTYMPIPCLPQNLNSNTATEVVANYLDTHPQERSQPAYTLVRRGLAAGYPCR